jgi:hypothetical protein
MPWLATLITDYQLHRRRLVLACICVVCALALLTDDALGIVTGLNVKLGLLLALEGLIAVYFARMALRELARMKDASH